MNVRTIYCTSFKYKTMCGKHPVFIVKPCVNFHTQKQRTIKSKGGTWPYQPKSDHQLQLWHILTIKPPTPPPPNPRPVTRPWGRILRTNVLIVFLLANHNSQSPRILPIPPPPPPTKSDLKLICNVKIEQGNLRSKNSQDNEIMPRNLKKLYVHEFGFWGRRNSFSLLAKLQLSSPSPSPLYPLSPKLWSEGRRGKI